MEIICDACKSKFKIPDEKIPEGKTTNIKCPKCKGKISITPPQKNENNEPEALEEDNSAFGFDVDSSDNGEDSYDADEKPFDFIEEEGKTALFCESDGGIIKNAVSVLERMEYHVTVPENIREALKTMRYHSYDLVIVNENFNTRNLDSNGVLVYLESLNMALRRNIFVAMLSERFRTNDNMVAFNKSVNIIINMKDMDKFDRILSQGISEHVMFYRVYKETLKSAGKA